MTCCVAWLPLLLCSAAAPPSAPDAKVRQLVKGKVEELHQALVKQEYAKVADLTHPKVIEEHGGRQKMIATVKATMQQLNESGFTFRVVKVELPTAFARAGNDTSVIAPLTLEATGLGFKVTQKTFLVGVSSDQGKTWTFINGDLGEAAVRKLLPDLPKKLTLPKTEKVVEKGR